MHGMTEKGAAARSKLTLAERNRLILHYTPWVKFLALQMASKLPAHIPTEDLISAGITGLIDALDKFNPAREVQFKTYAQIRIQGAMKDELRSWDWASRSMRQKAKRLEQTYLTLEQELGHPPASEEVAASLGISMAQCGDLLQEVKGITLMSLEDLGQAVGSEDRSALLEVFLTQADHDPVELLSLATLKKALMQAIEQLPDKERLVVSLYYFDDLTMKEIGKVLSLTESRVSQLHTQTILRLRAKLQGFLAG